MQLHPDAPKWTTTVSDELSEWDLKFIKNFEQQLHFKRETFTVNPPKSIFDWAIEKRNQVVSFYQRLPASNYVDSDWSEVPTSSREDIANRLDEMMPVNVDHNKVIIYRTSGTTGHVLQVPQHPASVACYLSMLMFALKRWNIHLDPVPNQVVCMLVGSQQNTVTYISPVKLWNNALFAKINLRDEEWPTPTSAMKYISSCRPQLINGDPISLAEFLRKKISCQPKAFISTAVAMPDGLKENLQNYYGCPVIEWYSLTETGPIGYACPLQHGYHVLPTDIFVEVLDKNGQPTATGGIGEVAVTGGRNPYLPLLRYRTGDWGSINYAACPCGDPMPRILDLEGRRPVLFKSASGLTVNPIDLSRIIRKYNIVQYQFSQNANQSCLLMVRPINAEYPIDIQALKKALTHLLGDLPVTIEIDEHLGDKNLSQKVIVYKSPYFLED